MRWFWQRRKKPESEPQSAPARVATATLERVERIERVERSTGRLNIQLDPKDALLRFVQEYLVASGVKVRIEDTDVVAATLPSGELRRYTTTLARARADEQMTLLVEGGGALTELLDECAERGRVSALRLAPLGDAVAFARAAWALPAPGCGRCVGLGGEPWGNGSPSCPVCPLRDGRLVLRWAEQPVQAEIVGISEAHSIELTYTIVTRDRRGRTDEVVRLAFESATGRRLEALGVEQLTRADAVALPAETEALATAAAERAQGVLAPALEAAAVFLRQRTSDEYQRRIAEVTTTHERLRRENPEQGREVDAALTHALSALTEVFAVEVDARLERLCYITSPLAQVAFRTRSGAELVLAVDVGRGQSIPPACAVCGADVRTGQVCMEGHLVCVACASSCGTCDRLLCPCCERDAPPLTACALCALPLCSACVMACSSCGKSYCAAHLWPCAGEDGSACLDCLEVCEQCQETLCPAHVNTCAVCSQVRCAEHITACHECGEQLCEAHVNTCVMCHDPLCAAHTSICEACAESLCERDAFDCLGCGRRVCACSAPAPCRNCQYNYCKDCRGEDETCPACRALGPAGADELAVLALAAERESALAGKKKWYAGRNTRAVVFASRGLGRQTMYVLALDGEVLHTYRKGWGK